MAKDPTSISRTELKLALDRIHISTPDLVGDPGILEASIIGVVDDVRVQARKIRSKDQRERIRDIIAKAKKAGLV